MKTIAQTFDVSLNHPLVTLHQKPFENIQCVCVCPRPAISADGCDRRNRIRMSPHVCASDTPYLRKGSRFDGHGRAAPAALRENSEELEK